MRNHPLRSAIAAMLAIAGIAAAQASTFSVGGSGNTFTISRTGEGTNTTETVLYRTVPLSAFPGQHYTEKSGTLVFAPGQTTTNITVTDCTPSNDAYRYQTGGASRSYRFEVTDGSGVFLDRRDASVTSGLTRFYGEKVSKSVANLVTLSGGNFSSGMSSGKYLDVSYTPPSGQVESSGTLSGYVLIDDSYDYAQKPATVSTANLINSTGATASYLDTLGYKIYATVCFTEKEKNDGYQYLQIIAGDGNATYDTGYDPEEAVNDPVNSIYKVCFELSSNSDAEGKAYFPHRGTTSGEFSVSTGKLHQQKYRSGYEGSGAVVLPVTTSYVTTRFDAGGKNDDTWGYKDFFVRMALCDTTPPSRLGDPVLAPGRYGYGNEFYVSVPFGEIVTVSGTPTISSDWGDLSYFSGSGSNVLTFKGTINAAIGTQLYLSTLSGTVTDLAGNAISIPLTINKSFPATVDYPWPGAGTAVDPYVITTTNQLGFLASCVNATYGDIDFAGKFFELGADISYDYQYDWDNIVTKTYTITCETEDNYTAIGGYGRPFKGTFDGRGHTISGVRITKPGSDNYSTSQGLFGYVGDSGTVKNIFLRDAMIYGYNNIGGIAGYNRGVIMGCTVYHVRVFTGQDVTSDFNGKGPITGYNGGTVTGSHYRDCATLKSDGFCYNSYYSDLVTLSTASDVAAEPATVETATIDGTLYYATGNTFSLSCSIPVPENWSVVYTATGGATVNDATLTLASDDTIVSAAVVPPDDYVAHWQAGSGHDGTSAKPYLITTPDGLQLLSSEVNHGTAFAGTYFQLGNDIDMGAVANFMPIGNEFFPFSGTFDGNGHTISGISISRPNTNYQGLFGFLYNATVMNLTLADSSIEGGESIGGIAGNFDYGSIQNCFVTGTTLSGGNFIGAIAGSCDYDTLSGNAYHGCAAVINGSTSTCNIGIGNTGDSPTRVWPCCTLAFAEGIAPVTAPQFSFPVYGTNNSYYAAGQTVIVRAAAGGYAFANVRVNGIDATDNGDGTFSFTMPAVDATVTADLEALPAIPYIDADGEPQVCADYTVITNATGDVTYGTNGAENWYVVTNAVTISGQLIFNDYTAHLILCDGASLAVTNGNGDAIYPSNNIDSSRELVLYGQANGTGGLVANGSGYGIRIHSGSVTINGGNVTATGGHPGIYAADTVTINGGSVTATGGEGNAGIYAGDTFTINGGSVTATGGYGIRVNNSSITINGGNVTATATSGDRDGIYAGGTFTINGGSVTATATGGKNGIYAGGDITINGGTVTATGGSDTANHNGIYARGTFTINGGIVTATGGYCGIRATNNKITLGWTNPADSITASGYYGSSVHVKDRQRFTDGDNVYKNNITGAALADLAGKTLVPAYSITLPAGVVASGVVTQDGTTAYALPGATVTLRAVAPGYVIGNVTVNGDTLEPVDGVYSFTASADGITVTAATVMTQWQALQTQLDAGGAVTLTNDVTAMSIDETLTVTNAVTLDLNGHTIDAASLFGAIRVAAGGHLTLTNSVPESGAITGGYSSDNGGGVCVDCGTFTMTGGAISGNAADSGGGGVYVGERGEFTMSGGEISGNSAAGDGGGVYMYYCNVSVLGSPVVFGNTNSVGAASNLYMDSWREIAVRGLSAGAYIGVTTKTAPTESSPVTFATGAAEGDETYFTSDNPGFAVYGEDGSLRLRLVVTYTVRFDANGGAGAMPDQTFIYDAQQALASNAFTRTGYTFAGWRGGDGSIYPDGATVSNLTVRHASLPADAWKLFDRMPYPGKTNDDYHPGDGALQNKDGDNGLNLYTGFENVAWNPEDPDTVAILSANASWFDEHDARNGVSMKLIEDFPNFYFPGFYIEQVDDAHGAAVTLTAIWQPHVPVPYIDADGNEQMCTIYNVLTNANGDVAYGELGAENWYVVTNDVTISGRLYFADYHAHLIVCDGATLNVTNENDNAIAAYGLAIHCQTNATGALVANGSDSGIDGDSVTINGGSVTATGGVNGICAYAVTINGGNVNATGGTYGIYPLYDLTINGGNINATGGYGIWAKNITLGWTNPTDSIYASSYFGRVRVKSGKLLTDGYGGIYEGDIQDNDDIAGKTLWPGFKDPEGRIIVDFAVIDWLSENGFTQADIDALGHDAAATDRLYECWLLNLNFKVQDAGATLCFTDITVSNRVSMTVQLVRKAPLAGWINGYLYLYGANDLAAGFDRDPIPDESVEYFTGDPSFNLVTASNDTVTQTAVATLNSSVTAKFFKAEIGIFTPYEPEDPWEPEPEDPEPEEPEE